MCSGIIAEKPSENLFILDTAGSEPIRKAYSKVHKPLKTDEILAQRSAIPAVDSRKRSKVTDGVLEPAIKRRKGDGVSYREYERLRALAYGGGSALDGTAKEKSAKGFDPWASESDEEDREARLNFLERPKPVSAPRTLKEAPIALIKDASDYPAVPRPKAGTSYNPMFEDYDRLLVEESAREIVAEKQRLLEAELEQQRLDRVQQAQDERDDIQTEDESAWEGIESEYESEAWLKRRRPERKTPIERNKIKRRKEAERQVKWDLEMKKRARQAQRIKEIAREIVERDTAQTVAVSSTNKSISDHEGDAVLRRRKFGKSR